jgi:hypothetical protein
LQLPQFDRPRAQLRNGAALFSSSFVPNEIRTAFAV